MNLNQLIAAAQAAQAQNPFFDIASLELLDGNGDPITSVYVDYVPQPLELLSDETDERSKIHPHD